MLPLVSTRKILNAMAMITIEAINEGTNGVTSVEL
jgi:hypothetical protein